MSKFRLSSLARNLIGSDAVESQRRAKQLFQQGKEIYDLGIGEPDGDTPEVVKLAAIQAIQNGESHYVDPRGLEILREKIAFFEFNRHQLKVDPLQVVVTVGSLGALSLAFRALLDTDDEVLLLEPFWGPYANMVKLLGANAIKVPAIDSKGRLVPDFQTLKNSITNKTKIVVINSPNNPSGKVWTKTELDLLAQICEEKNIWIVSDEVYSELTFNDFQHVSIASVSPQIANRTIIATSLSKSFAMTGWRIGYCVAPLEVATIMSKINHYSVRCAATISQWAAISAFDHATELLKEMCDRYMLRRELVGKVFQKYPDFFYLKPEGTFYAFVKVPDYIEDVQIFVNRLLEERGVVVSAGKSYGQSAHRYIRLSFATSDQIIEMGINHIGSLAEEIKLNTKEA